jgi:arginase
MPVAPKSRTFITLKISRHHERPPRNPDASVPPAPPRLIGLPYDASSSFLPGAAEAPPLIREALHSSSWNNWCEQFRAVIGPGALSDGGDLALPPTAEARARIEAGIAELIAAGHRPLALGGDHSVTYPVLRAVAHGHTRLTILHIDAHPDLYDEFEGDRFSHACPFGRIMEEGLASRLVQVGIRTMNAHQRCQADRFGVEVIDMRAWQAGARPSVDGAVYISIDLDGLDPAFAPGVSHRDPGGLSVREVIGLVQGAGGYLAGADIVEYNPRQDLGGMTATVAAKLVKEVAGRMMEDAEA